MDGFFSKIDFLIRRRKQIRLERKLDAACDGRTVLMFHKIYAVGDDDSCDGYSEYSISKDKFLSMLDDAKRRGYLFVSPSELFKNDGKKKVLLTFDDVFDGVYNYLYPELKRRNIPFCIFPAIDLIDKEGYLSEKMIREMLEDSECVLGSHSISHCILRSLSDSEEEISESKTILQKKFSCTVDCIAYPYGSLVEVGSREKEYAKKNYKYGFSTLQTGLSDKVDRYFIPRINVNQINYESVINRFLV